VAGIVFEQNDPKRASTNYKLCEGHCKKVLITAKYKDNTSQVMSLESDVSLSKRNPRIQTEIVPPAISGRITKQPIIIAYKMSFDQTQ
jgi:hypothetical protein